MESIKKYIILTVNGFIQNVTFASVNGINQKVDICAC